MAILKTSKSDQWKPVSARIPPELRDSILTKLPKDVNFSKLILNLLQRYADGKIIGLRLES